MISFKNKIVSVVAAVAVLSMTSALPQALAASNANSISIIPTITSVSLVNGVLTATGVATAVVNGQTTTVPFTTPIQITAQPAQPGTCPVLDLTLGPIDLTLLGLEVAKSPICLTITANQAGGLLGQLLCSLGTLLNQRLTVAQALSPGGLPAAQVGPLLTGLTRLLNQAVGQIKKAAVTQNTLLDPPSCSILHLELGPVNLTLLGLNVMLNNCTNGAITVDLIGHPGEGLLGDLLCQLLGSSPPNIGATLQQILNLILGLLRGL